MSACDHCESEDVKHVHITDEYGFDYGYFMFCEKAIKDNKERGFFICETNTTVIQDVL